MGGFFTKTPPCIRKYVGEGKVLEVFYFVFNSYETMEKRPWCPNGELIFVYNFTSKSTVTLLTRNLKTRASVSVIILCPKV